MKFVDRIIEDIPFCDIEKTESEYHNECKYLVDTRILLENLKDYEVEIPKEYFEKYEQKFGNGVLQYMEKLTDTDMENFSGGNTYNYNGRIIHDLDYRYVEDRKNDFYIAIQVHRLGDIRGNYTEFALFKFDYFESFFEVVDDICRENFSSVLEHNGKHYYCDISAFDESVRVWCEETQEDFNVYIGNDEELIEEIEKEEK